MPSKRLESFVLAIAIALLIVNFTYKAASLTWIYRKPKGELVNSTSSLALVTSFVRTHLSTQTASGKSSASLLPSPSTADYTTT